MKPILYILFFHVIGVTLGFISNEKSETILISQLQQLAHKHSKVSYILSGKELMLLSEKILYKKTPQEDMYLYLLRPEVKAKMPLSAIVYFTGGGWMDGSVD
jgi:acetyl esterase/lipase